MGQENPPADFETIARTLTAARAERTSGRARSLFEAVLNLCDAWDKRGGGTQAVILKAQTYAELALEASTPPDRTSLWKSSLATLEAPREQGSPAADVAEAYGSVAVDCFQDVFSDLDFRSRQQVLRTARDGLDSVLNEAGDVTVAGVLLARKSSVLRHLALAELTPDGRVRRLGQAVGCAGRAVQHVTSRFTLLELGLSEWALARHETTDERYVARLHSAEQSLSHDLLREYEPAKLALARFYRLTFQPVKACEAFPRQTDRMSNVRRVLRDSYILGEAASQLWFADYPEAVVAGYLSEARSLLELAIAAGYRNARIIVALAYVAAIMDGADAGRTALSDICTKSGVAWDQAIQLAIAASPSNLLEFGFALGIDQSAVWTRLGTFVGRFLGDVPLAEGLYRTAIRLDPHDAIALTNLARFLVRHGGPDARQEARRLIQKAQNFADRRFTWWRAVLAQLEHGGAVASKPHGQAGKAVPSGPIPTHFADMKDLRREFRCVEVLANDQQRGYELERLIYELAKLTVGTAAPAYRIERVGGGISQIDGYFTHGADKYRVECKWLSKPADPNDVVAFADKIDVVGVGGLFVSISGFTVAAIGRAREFRTQKVILLVDGDEIRALFNLQLNFDDVMARKRLHFDQRSEPYHRVVVPSEAA